MNIFKNVSFDDKFQTVSGKKAIYIGKHNNKHFMIIENELVPFVYNKDGRRINHNNEFYNDADDIKINNYE